MSEQAPDAFAAEPDPPRAGPWRDTWRALRCRWSFRIGAVLAAVLVLVAIAPGLFTRGRDLRSCDLASARARPSAEHWFGADQLGCDYLTQVVHGARNSLLIGVTGMAVLLVLGVVAGAVAGFAGGVVDSVLSRLVDVFYGVPLVLGALVLLKIGLPDTDGRGPAAVAVALASFGWMTAMRLVRGQVLASKNSDHVAAARALGASRYRVLARHVLPDAVGPVLAYATISIGLLIAAEATLTYLGVGLTRPAVSWGLQIEMGQPLVRSAPHLVLFPGLALFLTVATFVMLGDALRDALDPRQRA